MDTEQLLQVEKLVRQAGAKLMEFWPADSSDNVDVNYKSDGSPVTNADMASHQILSAGLNSIFPADIVLSEESPDQTVIETKPNQRLWIIDPLDGTNSFISGKDDFSILVALCENQEIVLSFMFFPALNLLAHGRRGQGAQINQIKLQVSQAKALRPNSFYYRNFEPKPGAHLFERKLDSGRAFLALCEGELDAIAMRVSQFGEHDFAAPAVMIEESGGRVSDEHGNPIKFGQAKPDYKYFVVSNSQVHEQVLEIIKEA